MSQRTLVEIDADIAKIRSAMDEVLTGSRVTEMGKGDRTVKFSTGGASDEVALRRRLAELRAERARVSGDLSPARPVRV